MVAIAGAAAAALGAGGSILGGMGSQREATKARRSQEYQFNQALNWQVQQYQIAQEQQAPWRRHAQEALAQLGGIANEPWNMRRWAAPPANQLDPQAYRWQAQPGVDPSQYGFTAPATVDPNQYRFDPSQYRFDPSPYRFSADPYTYRPGAVLDPSQYRYTPTESASLGRFAFTPPTVTDDPGYQFRLQQGVSALDASAAARGGLTSGAAQRALTRYGQELGSQEYQAAYGRSWQQQQEAYERARLANMTQEERQRYADATGYGRALTANQMADERARAASAQNYAQQFGANQFNANLGLSAAQQNFARDYQVASDYYNRLVQQQQTGFTQGIAANDLAYQRAVAANELANQRGFAATQWQYGLAQAADQRQWERSYQEWQAEQALLANQWQRWSTLAGYGPQVNALSGQLGQQSATNVGTLLQGLGTAQATGFINQANAANQMYSGIAASANQGLQNYLLGSYMQNLGNPGMGFNAAGQRTSGTLPTTWGQYTAGGFANPSYAPFG